MSCRVIINKMNINVVVFYRPLTLPQNGFMTRAFLNTWSTFMPQLTSCKSELIVVGDVNNNLDNHTLQHTVEFIQSLRSHGLQQLIQVPTHHDGHTLDGGKSAIRIRWMVGANVETKSIQTSLDLRICNKQIHGRKQISIKCNGIEHWVHLICEDIRLAQYAYT